MKLDENVIYYTAAPGALVCFGYFDAEFGNFSEFSVIVGLECDLIWLKTSNSANLRRFQKVWPVSRPKFCNV